MNKPDNIAFKKINEDEYLVAPSGPIGPKFILPSKYFEEYCVWLEHNSPTMTEKGRINPSYVAVITGVISAGGLFFLQGKVTFSIALFSVMVILPLIYFLVFLAAKRKAKRFLHTFSEAKPASKTVDRL